VAALPTEVKAFIVQSFTCYESPAKIIELVKEEFGIKFTWQNAQ
jgi:hypothetical protein